jgi:hypothetical protein
MLRKGYGQTFYGPDRRDTIDLVLKRIRVIYRYPAVELELEQFVTWNDSIKAPGIENDTEVLRRGPYLYFTVPPI